MSWNNIIPAWLIVADKAIIDYVEGAHSYEVALDKLKELHVPYTMVTRLDKEKAKKENIQHDKT